MNESMHTVAKQWYRAYWVLIVILTSAVLLGCVAYRFFPGIPGIEQLGRLCRLDSTTLFIAALGLSYHLGVYWIVRKRNETFAVLTSSMFFTLLLLNGMVSTDPGAGAWVFAAGWFVTAFFSGMFGMPFSMGTVMLGVIYVLLQSRFGLLNISLVAWVLIGGTAIVAAAGYLFWRGRYVKNEQIQMNKLNTMLKSNQEQSAIIIQSIADGVIVVATDGKITLLNLSAGLLTGWSIADATGVDVQSVVHLKKENGEAIAPEEHPFSQVLNKKQPLSQVLQVVSHDESTHIVSLVISPVLLEGGDMAGAIAVMRDVSQQRAEEQQRAEFISTASHEMRTPVAAIEGYLALALNDKVSTIDSRARGFLEKAHASTQHLGKLFQDLLTSAKAEDGRLTSHPVVVEMGTFTERLVEDLRFTAQKKGLNCEFTLGTSRTIDATAPKDSLRVVKPLYYIHADPDRLREVITNIFDNAVKYTDKGKVNIGLTGNPDVVQIYVRDTGPGIPSEDIPHLFQKFYRVDNSATRTIGGTGLGLFISRKIIELYHGRIWVESELGKGSTFYINLPRLNSQRVASLQADEQAAGATILPTNEPIETPAPAATPPATPAAPPATPPAAPQPTAPPTTPKGAPPTAAI